MRRRERSLANERHNDEQGDVAIVLDAGALMAIDQRDRRVGALLRVAQRDRLPVRTSAAVLAQVWRDGAKQAKLAMALTGVEVAAVQEASGRRVGELLARSKTSDVVDAHVAVLTAAGDIILTSDIKDLRHLLNVRGIRAGLQRV